MNLAYYIFSEFPNYWQGWTLAVLAVSENDARNYVRAWHRCKAKLIQTIRATGEYGGTVKAHCGGVTEEATKILQQKREKEMSQNL